MSEQTSAAMSQGALNSELLGLCKEAADRVWRGERVAVSPAMAARVRGLLEAGADPSTRDGADTCFSLALRGGADGAGSARALVPLFLELCPDADLSADAHGWDLLRRVATMGDAEIARAYCARPEIRRAIAMQNRQIAEWYAGLSDGDSGDDAPCEWWAHTAHDDGSPLLLACVRETPGVAAALLDAGADPRSALAGAAEWRNLPCAPELRRLLEAAEARRTVGSGRLTKPARGAAAGASAANA